MIILNPSVCFLLSHPAATTSTTSTTTRPEDQRTGGPGDQGTRGPEDKRTGGPGHRRTRGPEDQKKKNPPPPKKKNKKKTSPLKNISQIGSCPQIGVKIKNHLKPPPRFMHFEQTQLGNVGFPGEKVAHATAHSASAAWMPVVHLMGFFPNLVIPTVVDESVGKWLFSHIWVLQAVLIDLWHRHLRIGSLPRFPFPNPLLKWFWMRP